MSNVKTYSKKKDGGVKLSANFRVSEFACNDGSDKILIDLDNVKKLQIIRNYFNKSIKITSGYRTKSYNAKIGGASSSYHVKGMATDIVVKGVDSVKVAMYAESIGCNGVIWYPLKKFTHIDTRPNEYHAICINNNYYPEPVVTLKQGDNNAYIKWVQYMMNQIGYKLTVDGDYGAATKLAVKDFQNKTGLTADGKFGTKSKAKLKEILMKA